MVNKRRSEIEIIGDILQLSRSGARKTEILYQGNLSFSQLESYLSFLLQKDIISVEQVSGADGGGVRLYRTTAKGFDLLADINRVKSYFE